jgi:hypothetical protein
MAGSFMRGRMAGMSDDGQQSTKAPKCVSDNHQFEFFDNFPGYEIDECEKCGLRRFRNVKTGEETYGGGDVEAKLRGE